MDEPDDENCDNNDAHIANKENAQRGLRSEMRNHELKTKDENCSCCLCRERKEKSRKAAFTETTRENKKEHYAGAPKKFSCKNHDEKMQCRYKNSNFSSRSSSEESFGREQSVKSAHVKIDPNEGLLTRNHTSENANEPKSSRQCACSKCGKKNREAVLFQRKENYLNSQPDSGNSQPDRKTTKHGKKCACTLCRDRSLGCPKQAILQNSEELKTSSTKIPTNLAVTTSTKPVRMESEPCPCDFEAKTEKRINAGSAHPLEKDDCPCSSYDPKRMPKWAVDTKPTNFLNVLQRPRVPANLGSRCSEKESARPKHSLSCSAYLSKKYRNFRKECVTSEEIVRTKPNQISKIWQHPRIPNIAQTTPKKFKVVTEKLPNESCPCCPDKPLRKPGGFNSWPNLEHQNSIQRVQTKPVNAFNIFQSPRIPNSIVETSEPCPSEKCEKRPLKKSQKEETSNNFFASSGIADPIKTKRSNVLNVLQHPNIVDGLAEKHPRECNCSLCKDITCCKALQKSQCNGSHTQKSKERVRNEDYVKTKPHNIAYAFQHPRITNTVSARPAKIKSQDSRPCSKKNKTCRDTSFSEETCPEEAIRTKPSNFFNVMLKLCKQCDEKLGQHPLSMEESADCFPKPQTVLTKPTSILNVLQRPRIPNNIGPNFEAMKYSTECNCSICRESSRCKISPQKCKLMWKPIAPDWLPQSKTEKKDSKSETVRTKPCDLAKVFQHPRIPSTLDTTLAKKKEAKPQKESCPCTEIVERKKGGSCKHRLPCIPSSRDKPCSGAVRTKTTSILNVFQRPRIPHQIQEEMVPTHSYPCIVDKETKINSENCVQTESVLTKPKSHINIFQRPRIPHNIGHAKGCTCLICENETQCRPSPKEKELPKTDWLKRPDWLKIEKREPKSEIVRTKPCNLANALQHPRIPQSMNNKSATVRQSPKQPKESCICQPEKEKKKDSYQSVDTKSVSVLNILQRPRIPNQIGDERKLKVSKPASEENLPSDYFAPPEKVLTRPTNFCSVFQRPRIPVVITDPCEQLGKRYKEQSQCGASNKRENMEPKWKLSVPDWFNWPIRLEPSTDIVRTKPHDSANLFQHPRILQTINIQTDKTKPPTNEICPCTEVSGRKKGGSCKSTLSCIPSSKDKPCYEVVHTKTKSFLNIFQRPRIPNQIGERMVPFQSYPCIINDITKSCSEEYLKIESVLMKPKPHLNIFQRSRIPHTIGHAKGCICSICKNEMQCRPTPGKKESPKTDWLKLPGWLKIENKEPKYEIVRTKSRDLVNAFQHPRIPQTMHSRPVTAKRSPEQPKESCICQPEKAKKKDGYQDAETKPVSILNILQRPRIPNQIEDERKLKVSKPASEESLPSDYFAPPEKVLIRPTNFCNVLQRPRIPVVITDLCEQHKKRCYCSICKEKSQCGASNKHKKMKPKWKLSLSDWFNWPVRSDPSSDIVKTKPRDSANLFQHPRISQTIDSQTDKTKPPTKELRPCTEVAGRKKGGSCKGSLSCIPSSQDRPCFEEVHTKTTSIINIFQHPRIPNQIGEKMVPTQSCPYIVNKKTKTSGENRIQTESVLTKPKTTLNIFHRLRIPHTIGHAEGCTCSICENETQCRPTPEKKESPKTDWLKRPDWLKIDKNEPKSEIVRTKPCNLANSLQHPRIPQTMNNKSVTVRQSPEQPKESCSCKPEKKRKKDCYQHVETKPVSLLNALQRPRIPNQIGEERIAKISKPISEKSLASEFFGPPENILKKPKNFYSVFQRPRIPNVIPDPSEQHEKRCNCSICKEESQCRASYKHKNTEPMWKPSVPDWLNWLVRSEPSTDIIRTKPRDCTNLCRHPRIPQTMNPPSKKLKPPSKETCPCAKCEDRHTAGSCIPKLSSCRSNTEIVRTKPSSLLNALQRPRIPSVFDSGEKHKKRCSCNSCVDRNRCKTVYDQREPEVSNKSSNMVDCHCKHCKDRAQCSQSLRRDEREVKPPKRMEKPKKNTVYYSNLDPLPSNKDNTDAKLRHCNCSRCRERSKCRRTSGR